MNPFNKSINTEEALLDLAKKTNNTYFLNYYNESNIKRKQFSIPINHLKIDLSEKVFFDIGPGTGDSLLEARKMGAKKLIAIDQNPFFAKLQKLRGVKTFHKNYTRRGPFKRRFFPKELFNIDFIWSKGAINCVQVNDDMQSLKGKLRNYLKFFDFQDWIEEIIEMLSPKGKFLFMPAVSQQNKYINDTEYPVYTDYWVPNVAEYDESYFAKILLKKGFIRIKDIPKYNHPLAFPTAYLFEKDK
tara:strand:- start:236 stop:967 length:732 start_codon:yes stop_codon:yes gene_type:complete